MIRLRTAGSVAVAVLAAAQLWGGVPAGHASALSPLFYAVGTGGIGSAAGDGTETSIAVNLGGVGVAVDASGDLFTVDTTNARVVEAPTGGGPARVVKTGSVTLESPEGVAVDAAGDLFITDAGVNGSVVEVSKTGAATVVKTGSIFLSHPDGVAVDQAGDLFVADSDNNRVVEVSASGTPSVVNTGTITLGYVNGVAVDHAGDLFISDVSQNQVVEVPAVGGTLASGVAIVVNTGTYTLNQPYGVAVDPSEDVFIADTGNNRIVKVPTAGTASVVATGTVTLSSPDGVTLDRAGDLFIAGAGTTPIIEVPVSGTPHAVTTSNTGIPLLAEPFGVTVDAAGDLFITHAGDNQVVEVPAGGTPHVVNTGSLGLSEPQALAVDPAGDLFIADTYHDRVVEVPTSGSPHVVSTGSYVLSRPRALAADADGDLFIPDPASNRLVEVPARGSPRLVNFDASSILGPPTAGAVAVDPSDDLLVTANFHLVVVPAYHGVPASGSPIAVNTGSFDSPNLLAVDAAGDVFFTDYPSNEIAEMPAAGGGPRVVANGSTPWAQPYGIATRPARTYTVTFNAEGGSPAPITQTLYAGGHASAPIDPSRSGLNFTGWSTHRDRSGSPWRFTTNTVTSNVTLYAHYSATPMLGVVHSFGPNSTGWGQTRPDRLDTGRSDYFNGVDGSGEIRHIHWSKWESSAARGTGKNLIFKPNGSYYRTPVTIRLRATDLGVCTNSEQRAYRHLFFSEPSRPGGPFGPWHPWTSYHRNLCTTLPG
ncbi:MAG TPA: InlB B-repeat-containing protein [Mycobacteriales bacterium]|nr:InlB B-repeat-containing protein [Mycobacteriales bacterium]